jgi:hypothetical protein
VLCVVFKRWVRPASSATAPGVRGGCGVQKSSNRGDGKRLWRLSLLAFALAAALLAAKWSWVDAQARAVVALSPVLEAPVLTPVVEVVTGEPRFADTFVAGNPALVATPRGGGAATRALLRQRRGHGG